MPTNLENRERERQRKRESRAKGQRSLSRKRAKARDKKTKETFFVGETTWNFVAAVRKWEMLVATRVKMGDSEKKSEEHVRHFLHKTSKQEVSGSFTLLSCKTTAKKCTKKRCAARAFLLIRPIVVVVFFQRSRCLRRIALPDFIFCLSKV